MPEIFRWPLNLLVPQIKKWRDLGISSFAIFPQIDDSKKDLTGSEFLNPTSLTFKAALEIKSVISDVAYLAIYELDRMTGWTGIRNGNPEEAFSKDLKREAREAFSRDLKREDSEYNKNTEVLLSALEILDKSLDRYTRGDNRRLSLKERVEENIKDLKRELELDTKEGVSTTASSTDIGKPKAEIAQIIANDVINSLVKDPLNGR